MEDKSLPRFLISVKEGLLHSSDEHSNESLLEVLQGQEDRDTGANQFGAFKPPPVSHLTSPLNPDWNYSQIGQDNQLQFWNRCPIDPCPSNTVSFPGGIHSKKWRGLELKHANEVPLAAPHRYMLFGVNLVGNSLELPSPQVATSAVHESHNYVPVTSQSSVSEPSKSTSGVNSEKNNARTVALLLFRVAQRSSNMELYLEDLLISHNSMGTMNSFVSLT
ncbi:AUXIN RESPONSE FACTOR 4-RELATED [Salix viminalis]|uniref:AUXIN RESPONSE FACTOR 4-RELATED n=1 Tax=Salix viminalis TaxID=40686 RepID=A0A9Q0SF83_SALVM|nr:AUXIN RESPONSE FACTOR 4-RELATED [Salix viminalis]